MRPSDARRLWEWRLRIKRDTKAMRDIVYRELHDDDSGVDVGAHAGEFTEWFLDAAPAGVHLAIEPLPQFARHLRETFPSVVVHECALADATGRETFLDVVGAPAWSGFRQQAPVAGRATTEIEVEIRRLDELVGDHYVTLVKIDVEGAELGVLRGAEGVIERDRPVVLLEHAIVHAEPYGTGPQDVWTFFDERGYGVAAVADEARTLDLAAFVGLCEGSHASNYDRRAATNWAARPG